MNERIQELAEQAREYATTRHQVSNIVLSINNDKFEQKFAELIIEDACRVLLNWKGEPFPFDEDLAASLIKENFGVK